MQISQYNTEHSTLLDNSSDDLVDTATPSYGSSNPDGDAAKDGKEGMAKPFRRVSGPSGLSRQDKKHVPSLTAISTHTFKNKFVDHK